MYAVCKFNNNKKCAFCGKNGSGTLYCGIAKANSKHSNQIGRLTKCPRKKRRV